MGSVTVREKAFGKLNLSLDVVGKMDNGYHSMLMVMQSVSLHDDVYITIEDGAGEITAHTNRAYIPNTNKNLGFKAAEVFLKELGIKNKSISVSIKKRVPVCAGMGGGSSDAAAVIRGLNRELKTRLSFDDMRRLASMVDSDASFCIEGGTMLASGRGTELKKLPPLPDCVFLIAKPRFSVSTPTLFGKLDGIKVKARPDTAGLIAAIENGDVFGVSRRCFNVFEAALSQREKAIVCGIKDTLVNCGAMGASMTGTGSAVYGVFRSLPEAELAEKELKKTVPECYIASPEPSISE